MGKRVKQDRPTVRAAVSQGFGDRRVLVQPPAPPPVGLDIRPSHPTYDRVDRVEWQPRTGEFRVVTGTPGSLFPPSVTDGWEPVALVQVPRGSGIVTAANVMPVTPAAV